jgi:hypothetical protein
VIDDLATRVALSVAALLLLTTGFSVLRLSDDDALRDAAEGLARHLARQIDEVAAVDAHLEVRFVLPPDLGHQPYSVEIRAVDLRVIAGPITAVASMAHPIHPWERDAEVFLTDEVERRDRVPLLVDPAQAILLERARVLLDGRVVSATFASLPH